MKSIARIIFITVFVVILLLLCSYSAFYHDEYRPSFSYRIKHFQQFQNKSITLSGIIKEKNLSNNTVILQINEAPYQKIWILAPLHDIKNIKSGDHIELSGKLVTKQRILADEFIITSAWMHYLIYVRSIPAVPLILFFFFKNWRFNRKSWFFERRKFDA